MVGGASAEAGPHFTELAHVIPTRQLDVMPGHRSVLGRSGMVVSVNADATRVGLEILNAGGNAVDAAVAVAFVLAVTHPSAGNLGGGGFALVRLASGEALALDFRESSPELLDRSRFVAMIHDGGEGQDAVAIPGSVAGLHELSRRLGRLPFGDLVEPARQLASAGHRVSEREATAIRSAWQKLSKVPAARKLYGGRDRQPIPAGTSLRLAALAETLSRVKSAGALGFYTGNVAASIVASLGNNPQIRTSDLAAYRAIWRAPLEVGYRGLRVVIMPPPSAGGVALAESLTMLEAYEPSAWARGSVSHAHLLLEIMRRAQADRVYAVVDPDTLDQAQQQSVVSQLLDPKRWPSRCPINLSRATLNEEIVEPGIASIEAEHTTHLATVDQEGMSVSLTTTLSSGFGAKIFTDSGIVLNNALASFSGKGQNQALPNRRTTSSMAPTLIEDTTGLRLVLGTPGGDTIPSTLLQLINSIVDYGIPIDAAVDSPRLHQSIAPNGRARMERNRPIPKALERQLVALGHRFINPTGVIGHANTIAIIQGKLYGYADPREGGLALGRSTP